MTSVERRNLFKKGRNCNTESRFAFGLVFSLLMGVGIPLILEARGAKKLASAAAPSGASNVSAVSSNQGAGLRAALKISEASARHAGRLRA